MTCGKCKNCLCNTKILTGRMIGAVMLNRGDVFEMPAISDQFTLSSWELLDPEPEAMDVITIMLRGTCRDGRNFAMQVDGSDDVKLISRNSQESK